MDTQAAPREQLGFISQLGQHQKMIAQADDLLQELYRQIDQMKEDLAAATQAGTGPSGSNAELEALRQEKDRLQALLARQEESGTLAAQAAAGASSEELAALQEQLKEKDVVIAQLRAEIDKKPRSANECAAYESELNEFRREMEAERQALNAEIEQVRLRTTELTEAGREAELELSRERAQLARERVQLDRMREEVRQEVHRHQRDATMNEHLAPVQRLKAEVNGRHPQQSS